MLYQEPVLSFIIPSLDYHIEMCMLDRLVLQWEKRFK